MATSSARTSAADQKAFSEAEPVLMEEMGEPADSSSGDTRARSPPVSCKDHATRDTKISGKQAEDKEAQRQHEVRSGGRAELRPWDSTG